MTQTYKKKLIEVALPLEAINAASAREKSIRHGHPSTLHLWWARRPLAACRAVLFAQLVDDPSGYVDQLLEEPKMRKAAGRELEKRLTKRAQDKAEGKSIPADDKPVSLEDVAIDLERQRLFKIIEELVIWENSTNEDVLKRAREEIRRSCNGKLPRIYDPFSGGGSIPLEAQRIGLPASGSDLNPVAVLVGKALVEIPSAFRDLGPVHPGNREQNHYRNAEGLSDDVRFYGSWMREQAYERIGHLYPKIDLPREYGGGQATVIAWIWARTVPSPDPAFADTHVPIVSSFLLSAKAGDEVRIEPAVDKRRKTISYGICRGGTKSDIEKARAGTKAGRGANFRCLLSDAAITPAHVKEAGRAGQMGQVLIAVVAEGHNGRAYLAPSDVHSEVALSAKSDWKPEQRQPDNPRWFSPRDYGMETFGELFTERQLVAINTFSSLLSEVERKIKEDALAAGLSSENVPLAANGRGAKAYAEAIVVYLAFAIDRLADAGSSIATWSSSGFIRFTFARQAIPMTWDFAECNVFSTSTGNFMGAVDWIARALLNLCPRAEASIVQSDAQTVRLPEKSVVSTDPPYYDNIGYADLSDYFYVWLRRNVANVFPNLTSTISVPKAEELVATPYRHGGRAAAEDFFLTGMSEAVARLSAQSSAEFPTTIYYAFKQSEINQEGLASTGWATFLQAVIAAGYAIVGTWPVRTERAARTIATGTNALANSVVLVCRKRRSDAEVISRAEFIRALKRELPPAIAELQGANIAPADMPQSSIGPGMGIYSRYEAVLESDDSPMTVKAALQLINRELDEYLGGIEGEFDADTRFAITWFEQNGMTKGEYGVANSIAQARGISVDSVKHAGIVESAASKVRILKREELDTDWDPLLDKHLTVWECCQHLIQKLETEGEHAAAVLLKKIGPDKADAVKDLAYCLYDICSNKRKDAKEATSYNGLIAVWSELTRQAATAQDVSGDPQTAMSF